MQIVFDIGATHLRAAALLHGEPGEPLEAPTPQDPAEAMEVLGALALKLAGGEAIEALAGGSPGNLVTGRVEGNMPYLPAWDGFSITEGLHARFPSARVVVDNDGQVGCLGEATTGAGRGRARVAYVCIGTGIGGGLYADGALKPRGDFRIGWQIVDAEGHRLEERAGGQGVKERYGHPWDDLTDFEYAEVMDALAQGLRGAGAYWQPDIMVLGGAIPFIFDTFLADIRELVPELKLVLSAHGERSVLWGAAALLA